MLDTPCRWFWWLYRRVLQKDDFAFCCLGPSYCCLFASNSSHEEQLPLLSLFYLLCRLLVPWGLDPEDLTFRWGRCQQNPLLRFALHPRPKSEIRTSYALISGNPTKTPISDYQCGNLEINSQALMGFDNRSILWSGSRLQELTLEISVKRK